MKKQYPIDLDELERLAAIQSTQAEAAYVLGLGQTTLETRLQAKVTEEDEDGNMVEVPGPERQAWDRGKELGKLSLRRRIWEMSKKSPAVAIHLAKVHLGHTYRTELTGKDGANLFGELKYNLGGLASDPTEGEHGNGREPVVTTPAGGEGGR